MGGGLHPTTFPTTAISSLIPHPFPARKLGPATWQMQEPIPPDLSHGAARLERFEAETGATALRTYLDARVTPTPAFLRYAQRADLSFDWQSGAPAEESRLA